MKRLTFKKGSGQFPDLVRWKQGDKTIPVIRCGECGEVATLETHTRSKDGIINPSVVCPYTKEGCTWHVWLTLEGWEGV